MGELQPNLGKTMAGGGGGGKEEEGGSQHRGGASTLPQATCGALSLPSHFYTHCFSWKMSPFHRWEN